MPLGILSEDEYSTEIKDIEKGRGSGNKNTPQPIRNIIQKEVLENGRKKGLELAESLGISPSSVSAYTRSENGLSQPKNPELVDQLNSIKQRISSKATSKINSALDSITTDKINELSANKAAVLAKDLAAVTKSMSSDEVNLGIGPNFVIYAPKMKSEDSFEVIDLGE